MALGLRLPRQLQANPIDQGGTKAKKANAHAHMEEFITAALVCQKEDRTFEVQTATVEKGIDIGANARLQY